VGRCKVSNNVVSKVKSGEMKLRGVKFIDEMSLTKVRLR